MAGEGRPILSGGALPTLEYGQKKREKRSNWFSASQPFSLLLGCHDVRSSAPSCLPRDADTLETTSKVIPSFKWLMGILAAPMKKGLIQMGNGPVLAFSGPTPMSGTLRFTGVYYK